MDTYLQSVPQERRVDARYMKEHLDTLTLRVASLEEKQTKHMEQASRIEANTAELIETFKAFQGAWKVLNGIAALGKPLSVIGAFVGALLWWRGQK